MPQSPSSYLLTGLLRLLHPLVALVMPGIGKKWFKQLAYYIYNPVCQQCTGNKENVMRRTVWSIIGVLVGVIIGLVASSLTDSVGVGVGLGLGLGLVLSELFPRWFAER